MEISGYAHPTWIAGLIEGRASLKDVHVCSEKKDEFLYHFGYANLDKPELRIEELKAMSSS